MWILDVCVGILHLWILGFWTCDPGLLDFGLWILHVGFRGFRFRNLDFGFWICGLGTSGSYNYCDQGNHLSVQRSVLRD